MAEAGRPPLAGVNANDRKWATGFLAEVLQLLGPSFALQSTECKKSFIDLKISVLGVRNQ